MAPVKNVDSNYNCQVQKTFGTSMHKTWTPKFTNCRLVCTITCIKAELYNTCIFQSWACATFPFLRANRQCAHIWLKSPCLRHFHSIGAYVRLRLFLNHTVTVPVWYTPALIVHKIFSSSCSFIFRWLIAVWDSAESSWTLSISRSETPTIGNLYRHTNLLALPGTALSH